MLHEKRLIGNKENNSSRGQFPVLFLKQLLPCFDACEAACSVINMIHKLLKEASINEIVIHII